MKKSRQSKNVEDRRVKNKAGLVGARHRADVARGAPKRTAKKPSTRSFKTLASSKPLSEQTADPNVQIIMNPGLRQGRLRNHRGTGSIATMRDTKSPQKSLSTKKKGRVR